MAVTLQPDTVARVIQALLSGRDHRGIVVSLIDERFIRDVLLFFKRVVNAKIESESISTDWYREQFMNPELDKEDIALNAGLNVKTITNRRKSARKEIVIDEAAEHHQEFLKIVEALQSDDLDVTLTLSMNDVSVNLTLNESLVVINALAVRRAAIRGGAWSTLGKQLEAPLMEVLCRTFGVDEKHFSRSLDHEDSIREIDFYLKPPDGAPAKCEVKLMGQGNPEGADAIHARETKVFVASTLSELNKKQLDQADVLWTQLQERNGFMRFQKTLDRLGIPYLPVDSQTDESTRRIETAIRTTLREH